MINYDLKYLKEVFGNIAVKTVSETDISRAAYVTNRYQRTILEAAGFTPGVYPATSTVPLHILGTNEIINASYYGSQRTGSGRTPEYRMGRFIDRLTVGDRVAFVTDGNDVFMCSIATTEKGLAATRKAYEKTAVTSNEHLSSEQLIERAIKAECKPVLKQTAAAIYYRNPAITALAHRRSGYNCEMPECDYVGFDKYAGGQFIETHHIVPLSTGGEDSIFNVAALCPTCHRKMHYSNERDELSKELKETIIKSNVDMGIKREA